MIHEAGTVPRFLQKGMRLRNKKTCELMRVELICKTVGGPMMAELRPYSMGKLVLCEELYEGWELAEDFDDGDD